MNSVLSRLRIVADYLGCGAPKFVAIEKTQPEEQPRFMAEVLKTNWLGRRTYGAALAYVPGAGLLYVRPDGTANVVADHSLVEHIGDDVRFETTYPLSGPQPYVTFKGVGETCDYYHRHLKRHTLTELSRDMFEVEVTGHYSYERKYKVVLKK